MPRLLFDDRRTIGGIARYTDILAEGIRVDPRYDVFRLPAGMHQGGYLGKFVRQEIRLPYSFIRNEIDIYHCVRNFGVPLLGRVKKIVTIHDTIECDIIPGIPTDRTRRLRRRLQMKRASRLADVIITLSDYSKVRIMEELKVPEEKIRVVPVAVKSHFVTTPRSEARVAANGPFVLCVGGFDPRKNNGVVIQAIRLLRGQYNTKINLVIVGCDASMVNSKELESEGIFTLGKVSDDELIGLYDCADVFVFASLAEGFGIPPLEAMARGSAVICSNRMSLPEVVGNAGILTNPDDHRVLAEQILMVLTDTAFKHNLIVAGYRRVAEFSQERMVSETVRVYESL